ncbi:hypothetical protein G6M85_21040 [Agrobacterium tumefaciens]|uniref:DNA/RNA non-specific endonuclease n=1 Tax=Agrobacterium tumefaciens TaxID=358 RepID=UPI00157278CD|nr:DNA/RNA non-specific endonuclease [Agrobacterium tumefaciens]NTE68095.1 hypothetical protein [Agrobacterium tumefaciens]
MSDAAGPRIVRLMAPERVPFRFRIVGTRSADATMDVLSDENGHAQVELTVGTFLCYAEDLSRGTVTTSQIVISETDDVVAVRLGDGRNKAESQASNRRPSRVAAFRALNAFRVEESDPDLIPVISPRFNQFRLEMPIGPDSNSQLKGLVRRKFSVGISCDTTPSARGGWRAYLPREALSLRASSEWVSIDIEGSSVADWKRVRLSLSVEGDRPWQVNLPWFNSGLKVTLSLVATDFGPEIAMQLSASDPSLSLALASTQGTYPNGMDQISGFRGLKTLADSSLDPWTKLVLGLSSVRSGRHSDDLFDARSPWEPFEHISDAYVLTAWKVAAEAEKASVEIDQQCLQALIKARNLGRPYFSATSEVATEMLNALALSSPSADVRARAKHETKIWFGRGRGRIKTGPFYSWELAGTTLGTGTLPAHTYANVISGYVTRGQIEIVSSFFGDPTTKQQAPTTEKAVATDPQTQSRTIGTSATGFDANFLGSHSRVFLPAMNGSLLDKLAVNRATNRHVFDYTNFSLVVHAERRIALWVAANINGTQLRATKPSPWRIDSRLPTSQQISNDYKNEGPFSIVQLVRPFHVAWGSKDVALRAGADTFYYTNAVPKEHSADNEIWENLEDFILSRDDNSSRRGKRGRLVSRWVQSTC